MSLSSITDMSRLLLGVALSASIFVVFSFEANARGRGLTLDQAISKALAFDPRLKSEQAESAARRSETLQSSLSPNPELSVDIDNFMGNGDVSGFGGSEMTVGIDQKFELGGKRSARIARGIAAENVSAATIKAARRAVIARVTTDFYRVLEARKRVTLRRQQKKQFNDLLRPLKRRVEAGGSPEADLIRGQIAAEQAGVALETARFNLGASRKRLAANWSGGLLRSARVRGQLRLPKREALPLQSILSRLKNHPELQRFEALQENLLAELDVQKSLAVPDLTLGFGVRRFAQNDDTAFVAKGSIPLPFRNQNQGAVSAAAERIDKTSWQRDAVRQKLKRQLIADYNVLHRSCHETRRYANTIIPKARSSVTSIKQGYFRGRFKVVDLLDAISVLTQAQGRQTQTLAQCQIAASQIKVLTGVNPLGNRQ